MKAQFVSDQSELVRALDDFKRKAKYIFERAGLTDYWQVHPESIRLGVKPYFEVTIKPGKTDIDDVVQLDEQKLTFIERNMFITKSKSDCKGNL
jgi:Uma2 family endonuclease